MNWKTKANALTWLPLGLGGLALALVRLLVATRDGDALYARSHPAYLLLWLLTILALGGLGYLSLTTPGKLRYERLFPPSLPAAVAMALAACCLLINGVGEFLAAEDWMSTLSACWGILTAPVLGLLAWLRYQGRKPHFLLGVFLTTYFMAHLLLTQYRLWCAESQLVAYAFPLLGAVFALLACYERTAFLVNLGSRPRFLLLSRWAAFFCLAAIPVSGQKFFYLGLVAWMGADLCALRPVRRRERKGEGETP